MQFSSTLLLAAASLFSNVFADEVNPTEPSISGSITDETLSWELVISGRITHWKSVDIFITNNASTGIFYYNTTTLQTRDGIDYSNYIHSNITPNTILANFNSSVGEYSTLYVDYNGSIISGYSFTTFAQVRIHDDSDNILNFQLSDTLYRDGGSSSFSESSSIIQSPSSDSLSTSTTTTGEPSSTVITITSCDVITCSPIPVTTGVTVVTDTISGVVTSYTTYCPLTDTSLPNNGTIITPTGTQSNNYTIVGPSGTQSGPETSKTEDHTSSNTVTTYEAGAAGKGAITSGFFGILAAIFLL